MCARARPSATRHTGGLSVQQICAVQCGHGRHNPQVTPLTRRRLNPLTIVANANALYSLTDIRYQ